MPAARLRRILYRLVHEFGLFVTALLAPAILVLWLIDVIEVAAQRTLLQQDKPYPRLRDGPAETKLFPKLKANRNRLNKMLAHLTYRGAKFVELGDKHWPFVDFRNELRAAWRLFMSELDTERRAWFPAEVEPRFLILD